MSLAVGSVGVAGQVTAEEVTRSGFDFVDLEVGRISLDDGERVVQGVTGDAEFERLSGLIKAERGGLGVFVDGIVIDRIVVNSDVGDVFVLNGEFPDMFSIAITIGNVKHTFDVCRQVCGNSVIGINCQCRSDFIKYGMSHTPSCLDQKEM
jgi:hypothetical protein